MSWHAPDDAIRAAFRQMRDDLRTELSDRAAVTSPEPPRGAGPEGRDWDPDDVSITPRARGAARVWWSQSARNVQVGVGVGGASANWQLPRDDTAVAVVRQVVDAAVAGRVQPGWGEVDYGGRLGVVRAGCCRASLLDGTLLEDPGLAARQRARVFPAGPVEWGPWAEPYV